MKPGCMAEILKPAKCGIAEIRIDAPSSLERLRGAMHGKPLGAEKYARLLINGHVYMTDAEFECETNQHTHDFTGSVLIGGLGIGLVPNFLLSRKKVTEITVLELHQNVIDLVAPYLMRFRAKDPWVSVPSLKFIKADVFKWTPPKKAYDFVYMDVWSNVPNSDNDKELMILRKKYRPSLKVGGQFRTWCGEE